MKEWTCNIGTGRRVFRGILGAVMLVAGIYLILKTDHAFWGCGLCTIGAFGIFEAIVGWCALRAMGIRAPF